MVDNEDFIINDVDDDNEMDLSSVSDKKEEDSFDQVDVNLQEEEIEGFDNLVEEESSKARMIIMDFLEGTFKKSEAIAYAKGFIDNNLASPSSSYIYAAPYSEGFAVEIHDGGDGKAYLPNVLEILNEDPLACVCVKNRRRVLEIKRQKKEAITSVLLPEGIESLEENVVYAKPSVKMRPYSYNGVSMVLIGSSIAVLGFIFLLLTALTSLFVQNRPVKVLEVTKTSELPVQQWTNLMKNYDYEQYVEKLTYEKGRWKVATRKKPVEKVVVKATPQKIQQEIESISKQIVEETKAELKEELRAEIKTGHLLEENEKQQLLEILKENVNKTE